MKKILMTVVLFGVMNTFSAESRVYQQRIECMSQNKKIHVALEGNNEFDSVKTLTIVKAGFFGVEKQYENPNCVSSIRYYFKGTFLALNCPEQNVVVNQLLIKDTVGTASFRYGSKWHKLSCEFNEYAKTLDGSKAVSQKLKQFIGKISIHGSAF